LIASDVSGLVNSQGAKNALVKGIANVTGVPSKYVDVDLSAEPKRRRLRTQQLSQGGILTLTYSIAVGGDAPASVTATGLEISNKLKPTNFGTIADTISASVDQSLGSGAFGLSIQHVSVANVVEKYPVQLSTSSTPTTESVTWTVTSFELTTSMLPSVAPSTMAPFTMSTVTTSTTATSTMTPPCVCDIWMVKHPICAECEIVDAPSGTQSHTNLMLSVAISFVGACFL